MQRFTLLPVVTTAVCKPVHTTGRSYPSVCLIESYLILGVPIVKKEYVRCSYENRHWMNIAAFIWKSKPPSK